MLLSKICSGCKVFVAVLVSYRDVEGAFYLVFLRLLTQDVTDIKRLGLIKIISKNYISRWSNSCSEIWRKGFYRISGRINRLCQRNRLRNNRVLKSAESLHCVIIGFWKVRNHYKGGIFIYLDIIRPSISVLLIMANSFSSVITF